jgi:DNA modification methylase
MMPTWLARDLIISFSNVGDMILDPFGGSGTTPYEAMQLKRNATVIEINPDYIKDMKNYLRLNEQLLG